MNRCTAPVRGHRVEHARRECPACGGESRLARGGRLREENIRLSDESGYSVSTDSRKPSATPHTDEARTYPTQCRWCGDTVFFHTNGYGDAVLFDSLGSPWPVHSCWQEYQENKKKIKFYDLSPDDAKCLILAGIIKKLQEDKTTPSKEAVAKAMRLSTRELHTDYGHLYVTLPGYGKQISIRRGF